ncbi:MAG: LptF/LptG family permease [Bacteroidales bacterium]
MTKIHRLVLKSYIPPFILTFFVVIFLLLMQFLWKYIDDLVGKGLNIAVISELLLYTSASLVPLALPLATMLASIMTFGNLGENNELIAMKSAGISLQRIFSPLIFLSVLISLGAFFFANNMLPQANLKMRALLYDVQRQRPELNIKAGQFYNGIDGYSIKIDEKEPRTNLLRNIMVYDHTGNNGNITVIRADSGYMRVTPDETNLILTLYNGVSYNEIQERDRRRRREKTYPHRKDQFSEQVLVIELQGFGLVRSDENLFRKNYQMMNIEQLEYMSDSLRQVLHKKERDFRETLVKNHLFPRNRIMALNRSGNQELPEITNFDTLFHSFPLNERISALRSAVSQARSTQNYISTQVINIMGRNKNLRKYQSEWHMKFTLSFACLIFFFIGAPMGAIVRKGGIGMPVVVSTLFFVFYYILSTSGKKAAVEGVLDVPAGIWLSSFVLLPIGIFLTYKATTDSVILNIDTYLNLYKKVLLYVQRKLNLQILPMDFTDEDTDNQQ